MPQSDLSDLAEKSRIERLTATINTQEREIEALKGKLARFEEICEERMDPIIRVIEIILDDPKLDAVTALRKFRDLRDALRQREYRSHPVTLHELLIRIR